MNRGGHVSPLTQTPTEKHDDIQHQHTQTPNIRRIPDVPGQPHRCRGTGPGRGWRRRDAVHGHQRPKEDGLDQGVKHGQADIKTIDSDIYLFSEAGGGDTETHTQSQPHKHISKISHRTRKSIALGGRLAEVQTGFCGGICW